MLFVRHQWKLSENTSEWLFDGLFSDIFSWIDCDWVSDTQQIALGCQTLNSNSLTPLWHLKWTIFCVPCMRICSAGLATKHQYGNFQQKAHGSHGEGGSGSVTIFLQRGAVQRKPLLFERQIATWRFQSSLLSPLFLHWAYDARKELAVLG